MGTVTKGSRALLGLVLIATATGVLIFLLPKERIPEKNSEPQNESVLTYNFSESTPPKLKEDLLTYFKSQGWEEGSSQSSDIKVYKSDSYEDIDNALNLYQIWVFAHTLHDYLGSTSLTTFRVSEDIDVADPETEIAERIRLHQSEVSLETSDTQSRVSLIPIEQLNLAVRNVAYHHFWANSVTTSSKWSVNEYPLVSHTAIEAPNEILTSLQEELLTETYISEHYYRTKLPADSDFVTVIKTGTTVSGGPGWELCERTKGRISYPIEPVKEVLAAADITIISNEGSFVEGCSQAAGTTAFCGKPSYIQNLKDIGTDIISLTGNHMCDYGKQAFSNTLDVYTSAGMKYFGGGKNAEEARRPLYVETPAGILAFIGTNLMGPTGVIATETAAGTSYYDQASFSQSISEAKESADIIWVDTQLWPEYGTVPGSDQIAISQEAASFGASIVTGVSSHELQGMTYVGNTPVFYGLGNFLFDQMWSQETRQGMVFSLVLFEKKIIDITFMPTILYDYCQPRFAEGKDKEDLLNYFFEISSIPE